MAGEKIVGKINEIQGGDVLIIRASGERVIAKAGDVIQEGDTIVASVSSSVAIRVDKNGLASSDGVVIINAGEQAQFDAALFDNTASLISASSQENPVNVGSKPTLDVVRIFNTTFPNSKINATQPDNTNSVIDDPRGENPSLNQDLLLDQNLLPNRNPDIVEKLPGIRGFDLTNEKLPSAPSNRNNPDQNTNDPSQQDDIVELIGNPDNLLPATNTNAPAVTVDPNIVIPNDNSLGLNNDDLLVAENATTTGTFTISALQGITSLQIASTTVSLAQLNTASTGAPIDIVGESFGFLDIIDFDSTTGVVTYSYDPTGTAQDHSGATNATLAENLTLIVTDASATAETITVTLNIGITDTTPTANDDARSISEGTFAIAGNVFGIAASATGDVQDVLIDPNTKPVTAVSNVALNFGSITMSDSGVYTYTLDNTSSDVQGLKGSESLTDVFTYTITDGDGDTDTATLSVTVNGVEDALPTVLAPTNSVTDGSGNTVNGTFTASASAGLTSVTLAAGSGTAQDISGAITGTASSHVTLTGADGNLIVTNFNTATGVVTYNYTENGTLNAATTDNFSIVAVDNESDTDTETLSITIDDLPLVTIPDNNGVSTGEESVVENASGAGLAASFTVSASVGLQTTGTALSLTVDGTTTNLTLAQLNGLGGAPVTITDGNDGNLTLQSFNAASGVVAYTFDPTGTSRDHSGGDESVVEQYSIVATDANGNSNASAEVLDILITDTNPTANDDAPFIFEGRSAIAGNVMGTASSATGDVSDTLVDSTSSVTDVDFGGTDGTVGTGLAGNYGSIVISSTGVYTYTLDNTSSDVQGLKGSESLTDVFTYTITDGDGDTDTASLTVTIYGVEDALPTVLAPTNSVTDGSGNTVNGTFTASASAGLTSVTLAAGSGTAQDISGAITGTASSHVTLTGADGNLIVTNFNTATGVVTYNYTENGTLNAATTDNFSIVAVDNESDTDTETLSITIDDLPLVTIPDNNGVSTGEESVVENASGAGLAASFTVSASVGLQTTGTALSLTVDGTTTNLTLAQLNGLGGAPVTITDGNDGNLTLQSFNAASGVVAYTFDPTGTSRDHSGGDESVVEQYSIVATDANGNSNASAEVLDILITDTNPTANDDARSISEGTPAIAGNVVGTASSATGDVSDTLVDSNANPVTDVDFGGTDGTVGTGLAGNYGSIVISSVGVYTYTLDNTSSDVQGLKGSESLTDVFTYTITDGDGDTDTASLTVTINGVDDPLPTINVVDNNGSATGEHSVEEATGSGSTVMSTMNITASAGVAALTIAGQDVTNASTSTPSSYVTVNGSEGTLIVTNFNAGTFSFGSFNASTISYSYTEDGNNESHSGGEILDNFAIAITDNEGDTASDSLGIQILDTAPTAAIDSGSVTEDAASNTATGDVTTNDSQGADTAISVTGIDFGGAQAVNTPFSSSHGTLDLNADGTYTYTLDNGDSAVNALNSSQTLVEIFTYTIADTDGDASTSTLAITINGVNETVITSTTTAVNETLTGTSASENFFTDTVLGVSDGATGGEVIDSNGGSDRLIINGDDIPMVAGNGDNEGQGDRQGIELQDWTFANTASNVQGDVVDISDLLEAAGADTSGDGTITAAEATPFIHLSENEGSTTGGVISIDVGGGFTTADRTAINAGGTVTGKGTGDRDLVIFSNDASADLDTAAAAGGYTGTAYSAVESDQTAQIQALLNQNILVIDT